MARDRRDGLRFAPLQGTTAEAMFARHPAAAQDPEALASLVFLENLGQEDERVTLRSTAVARVFRRLGGPWGFAGLILSLVPRWLRDWGYDFVSRHRIRWFGVATPETCPLPTPEQTRKLLP